MPKIEYSGCRNGEEPVVAKFTDGEESRLNPRHDLRNHSPDGFEWGYPGSGPAQLALAIVADAMDDDARAQRIYQDYKTKRIGTLDRYAPWKITKESVLADVEELEKMRVN